MELPELFQIHEAASRQVELLERSLSELQQRSEAVAEQELNYIIFKMTVAEGIKKMYEEYRDKQWTKLQEESTTILQEILDIEHQPNQPAVDVLTPPESPPSAPRRTALRDLSIFNIPAPLTPISDSEDLLSPTSPQSHRHTDRHHISRNLSLLFSGFSRDL